MRSLAALLLVLAAAAEAWARVGGGHSYGGGGAGGGYGGAGYGGGEDGGVLIYLLLRLVIEYPAVGVPLAVGAAAWWYYQQRTMGQLSGYSRTRDWSAAVTPTRRQTADVRALQDRDPNFSRPLFLDFMTLLYTRVQSERTGDMAGLAAYVSPRVREGLRKSTEAAAVERVGDVIVGSIRLTSVEGLGSPVVHLKVDLETNYTEQYRQGGAKTLYSVERWTLSRKAGVLSQAPEAILKLACPSCGSPSELDPDGRCPYCGSVVNDGSFAWVVTDLQVRSRVERPPLHLGPWGQEVGTELPTRYAADYPLRRKEFVARHPDFSWKGFTRRVEETFMALQEAWASQQWERARPYETDHLFSTHRYWIEAYRRAGLTNRLEEIELHRVEPVKIEVDAYYEAITVRLWASMKDYTVDASGKVVGGSARTARRFSEYWTFIRRTGSGGRSGDPRACPSCGAPLDRVNMAGVCQYCGTKVTTGEFDWVLSQIEQDEAYAG